MLNLLRTYKITESFNITKFKKTYGVGGSPCYQLNDIFVSLPERIDPIDTEGF